MYYLPIVALGYVLSAALQAPPTEIDFTTAVKSAKIAVQATGYSNSTHYLRPLQLTLRNRQTTALQVRLDAGLWFRSEDSTVQDIVLTETEWLALAPGETKTFPVAGMCIQSSNSAPDGDDKFVFYGHAKKPLQRMAQKIDSANWQNSQAQMAMWAIANRTDIGTIYCWGDDAELRIMTEAAKVMGQPAPDRKRFAERAAQPIRYKAELKGKFSFNFSRPVPVHIALFTESGIVLKEIYRNTAPAGKHEIEYTFDAFPYTGQTIFAKFIAFDDVLMTRTIAL